MGNYNFRKDLEEGKKVEQEFLEIIAKNPAFMGAEINSDKRYDVKANFHRNTGYLNSNVIEVTYEVKDDQMAAKTGNVAIEFECRGNPSGIATSEADFWVIKIAGYFYMIPTEKLKDIISKKYYRRIVSGGDRNSNTLMYLFSITTIDSFSSSIKVA